MIKVMDLRTGYGGVEILHGVSFELQKGECLSVIGPNGCGKTTLLRAMAGTLPFSGDVLLGGLSTRKLKRKALAGKISLLSQTARIYFSYTVLDTVLMGRYAHGGGGLLGGISAADRLAAQAALQTVDLLDLKDREVDTLSGGQLQRVFLAKIIAQDPDVVLLDEPTNHLDFSYQIGLIRFLKGWAEQEGKTIIGVLHDINLAMHFSDKIMLLENGVVRAYGNSRDVCASDALADAYRLDMAAYMLETLKKWEDISGVRQPGHDGQA